MYKKTVERNTFDFLIDIQSRKLFALGKGVEVRFVGCTSRRACDQLRHILGLVIRGRKQRRNLQRWRHLHRLCQRLHPLQVVRQGKRLLTWFQ